MSKAKKYLAAIAGLTIINNAIPGAVTNFKEISNSYYPSGSDIQADTISIFETSDIAFSLPSLSISEGAGVAKVYVERKNCGSSGDPTASVDYLTSDGSAEAGQDYTAVSGTLTWGSSGDCAPKFFEVPIIDDEQTESSETVNLTLHNAVGGSLGSSGAAAVLHILDNDDDEIAFLSSLSNISEGEGIATIYVERTSCGSSGGAGSATVDYSTVSNTAIGEQDFTEVSGTLTWNSSTDCGLKSFDVPIINDTQEEASERLYLYLSNPIDATLGSSGAAQLTILDDDASNFGFAARTAIVSEEQGSLFIDIERKSCTDIAGSARVDFDTSDGSATNRLDYQSVSGTLSWGSSGDCGFKTITVPILDDDIEESTETLLISLSNEQGDTNGSSGGINAGLSYIVDDDGSPISDIVDVPGPYPFTNNDVITACDRINTTGDVTVDRGIDGTFLAPTVSIDYKFIVKDGAVFRVLSEEMSPFCTQIQVISAKP